MSSLTKSLIQLIVVAFIFAMLMFGGSPVGAQVVCDPAIVGNGLMILQGHHRHGHELVGMGLDDRGHHLVRGSDFQKAREVGEVHGSIPVELIHEERQVPVSSNGFLTGSLSRREGNSVLQQPGIQGKGILTQVADSHPGVDAVGCTEQAHEPFKI